MQTQESNTASECAENVVFRQYKPLSSTKKEHPFPIQYLPEVIKKYVLAVSESIQVSPDMPAVLALAVLALTVQRKAKIMYDSMWKEELNLYLCILADPAERKTPVFKAMMAPVQKYTDEYNSGIEKEIRAYEEKKALLENKKTHLIQSGKDTELEELNKKIDELVPVRLLKLTTTDITAESLAEKLSQNNESLGIMCDEGGIFDIISGLYSSLPNVTIYLNAYDGTLTIIDRKTGSIILKRPLLTFGICAQKCILNDLMRNKVFTGRGFVQRFMFSVPPSMVGSRTLKKTDEKAFNVVKDEYSELIYSLLRMPHSENEIRLSDEATELFNKFYARVEAGLGAGGIFEGESDYFGKIAGRALRIAGILHMAEYRDINRPVDARTMHAAIEIAEYFITQSTNIFEEHHNLSAAETVFNKILKKCRNDNTNIISFREIKRSACRKLEDEMVINLLETLVDFGYLAELPIVRNRYNGRKKPDYMIRPELFNRLA